MNSAFDKFRDHVKDNSLVAEGDRILLAVSAGKDSMAMLYMMQQLKDSIDFTTGVFHLNHLTRGAESDADALFVEKAAHGMGLFCRVCSVDVNAQRPGGVSFEEFARDMRYRLLAETAAENGFSKVATAHNSDDNNETVLMRVLSGTGVRGLRGIPVVRGNIIRPMLQCSADEIYEYLGESGYTWREDASNSGDHYLRNFIRNRLFPVINERFPGAPQSISSLSRVSAEQVRLLDDSLAAAYSGYLEFKDDSVVISHPGLKDNLPALRYIISRELGDRYGMKVSMAVLDEITRNYLHNRSNNTLYERDGIKVLKRHSDKGEEIVILHSPENVDKDLHWEYVINIDPVTETEIPEAGIILKAEDSDFEAFCTHKNDTQSVFLSVKPGLRSFTARNRGEGDRIILGFGSRKIKDLMIEKKLDSHMKNTVPIITVEGELAACLFGILPGSLNRISCNFLACNDSERIIRINIKAYRDI